jgi:hypothetical protein
VICVNHSRRSGGESLRVALPSSSGRPLANACRSPTDVLAKSRSRAVRGDATLGREWRTRCSLIARAARSPAARRLQRAARRRVVERRFLGELIALEKSPVARSWRWTANGERPPERTADHRRRDTKDRPRSKAAIHARRTGRYVTAPPCWLGDGPPLPVAPPRRYQWNRTAEKAKALEADGALAHIPRLAGHASSSVRSSPYSRSGPETIMRPVPRQPRPRGARRQGKFTVTVMITGTGWPLISVGL